MLKHSFANKTHKTSFLILLEKQHYKNIKLQMFPIAAFYFGYFLKFYVTLIMVHTQLWTKQSNVKTNTKYTSHVNSF